MIKLFEQYKNGIEVSLIDNEYDKRKSINITNDVFKKYGGFLTISGAVDFSKSLVLKKDGNVIGAYLLGNHPIHVIDNLKHYLSKRPTEGVALAIKPKFRGLGYGNLLKDFSIKDSKSDYIWGMQLKDLDNVSDWIKRRRIVYSDDGMLMTLQDIKDTFPNMSQTSGINCGSTALKILLNYYRTSINPSLDRLTNIMEVDTEFGTTDVRMKKGIDYCNLNSKQIVTDIDNAINLLKNYLKNDRKILLRTLIHGVKHWCVVYDYNDGRFYVSDSWLGKITYDDNGIYNIWEPRNFDGFVVYGEKSYNSKSVDDIIKVY